MNSVFKYFVLVCLSILIGVLIGALGTLWWQSVSRQAAEREEEVASIKWRQNHFILNEENLRSELIAQGIDFPEIVEAQAILETGHFRSHACLNKNNLFGLRNRDGTYMSFPHWTLAVAAYKKYIQKYDSPPDDYYKYLEELGYAEAPDYTIKLKEIVNKQ